MTMFFFLGVNASFSLFCSLPPLSLSFQTYTYTQKYVPVCVFCGVLSQILNVRVVLEKDWLKRECLSQSS